MSIDCHVEAHASDSADFIGGFRDVIADLQGDLADARARRGPAPLCDRPLVLRSAANNNSAGRSVGTCHVEGTVHVARVASFSRGAMRGAHGPLGALAYSRELHTYCLAGPLLDTTDIHTHPFTAGPSESGRPLPSGPRLYRN